MLTCTGLLLRDEPHDFQQFGNYEQSIDLLTKWIDLQYCILPLAAQCMTNRFMSTEDGNYYIHIHHQD